MRVLKTFYLVALFSLSMGLFCGELPEELSLRDDTSNDYVNDSSASAAKENEAARKEAFPEQRIIVNAAPIQRVFTTPTDEPLVISCQELLQHLSVRRT